MIKIILAVHPEQQHFFQLHFWLTLPFDQMNNSAAELASFQKNLNYIFHENHFLQTNQLFYNNISTSYSSSLVIGLTLTAPIQLWQQAKSNPIRSFLFIFQLLDAISN